MRRATDSPSSRADRPGGEAESAAIPAIVSSPINATRPACSTDAAPVSLRLDMPKPSPRACHGWRAKRAMIGAMEAGGFGGLFGDPEEMRRRMEELAEQMQGAQKVAWAD